jgi:ABC-2 type transport system permease protein
VPMRIMVAVPVAIVSVLLVGPQAVPQQWWGWPLLGVSLLGGWLITFLANVCIGTMALYMESSQKVMDIWLVLFFVFSGYMFPVAITPPWLHAIANWLPFRYQIGLPVELMTSRHTLPEALWLMRCQWLWVLLLGGLAVTLWQRGLRRFAAYGG